MAKIYHAEIFGSREAKYSWLNKNDIKKVKWKKCAPISEFYLFIPSDNKLLNQYNEFPKITEIFPVNSVGIVTARDNFVIDFDRKKLERRITDFRNPNLDDDMIKQTYALNENQSWKIKEQREKLRKDLNWKDSVTEILYRPFDVRWIFYHDDMIERSRKEVMDNLLYHENIALITSRLTKGETFKHAQMTNKITEVICMSPKTSNNGFIFPLYIYLDPARKKKSALHQIVMFEPEVKFTGKTVNIISELFEELRNDYKKEVTPEEIFYYIYAILYSNTYRTKYAEFLKRDFPRIPFTSNYKLFIKLGKLGKQLEDLHLLNSDELSKPISKFSGKGDNKITQRPKYENEKVYINATQYFTNVKEEVWNYQIGGYQVCDKWLKDRKDRELSLDESQTYCKIVTALSKTIELQKKIDENYTGIET